MDVRKTSIYLDDDVDTALARRAAAEGTTKAELIRRTLREAARGAIRVKPKGRAVFEGPADLSMNADDYLDGLGES
jgi:hypothetical protein